MGMESRKAVEKRPWYFLAPESSRPQREYAEQYRPRCTLPSLSAQRFFFPLGYTALNEVPDKSISKI